MLLVTVTTQSNRRYYVKWRDILHHHWCTQRVLAGPSHPWMPKTNYIYHTLWPVYVLPCTLWHLLHFGALQPPHRWGLDRHPEHLKHVRNVLQRCRQRKISLKWEKFMFTQSKAKFSGYIVGLMGLLLTHHWQKQSESSNAPQISRTALIYQTSQSAFLLHWLNLNSHGTSSSPSEDEKSIYVGRQPWPGFWRHQAGPQCNPHTGLLWPWLPYSPSHRRQQTTWPWICPQAEEGQWQVAPDTSRITIPHWYWD